jgi:uncharacterized ferredoxin-like protein
MEPIDSRICRQNASRCAVFAAKAESQDAINSYLTLSKEWEELAIELERLSENESEHEMQRYAN